jgi:putative FmdB family regulatory protein
MPLYEYQCESCGHRFEVIQKFSDAPVDTCPTCGGPVQKLLSSPAIQFKGSGWYITDYARSGKSDGGASAGKSGGTESKADSGGTSTESKPAAPAPSKE